MADFEKYDREKIKEKIKSKRLFITASSRSENTDTILTESFQEMSKSFSDNTYLYHGTNTSPVGGLVYMMNEMQGDIDDIHSELSQSVYVAQVSEFSSITTGSFGNISSSLIPDEDNVYNLGSASREWKDLYVDGTAYVDTINLNGTAIARTAAELNAVTSKLDLSGGTMTGLIRPTFSSITTITNNTVDCRRIEVLEIAQKQAWTLTLATPAHPGQQLTIIALTAGTITHTAKAKLGVFTFSSGRSLTARAGAAYFFVTDTNGIWRSPY